MSPPRINPDVRARAEAREEARRRNVGQASITFRLPEDLRRDVDAAAVELNVSLNAFAIAALEIAVGRKP